MWPRWEKGAAVGRPRPKACTIEASSQSEGLKVAAEKQEHHLIEKRSLVELGWLWKRLAEVGVVRGTVLEAREACEHAELSGRPDERCTLLA